MTKDLRTFLADMKREYPDDVVLIEKTVNPLNYDVTAIVKHLGAAKKFPILLFAQPLNPRRELTGMRLVTNCENSQRKVQVALGVPKEMDRTEMARECLRREAARVPPDLCRGTVVLCCGSGVTLAGLLIGLKQLPQKLIGISSGRSVTKIRAYIITTCQNVQPFTLGMRWKIAQMTAKPASWTMTAEAISTTKSAS